MPACCWGMTLRGSCPLEEPKALRFCVLASQSELLEASSIPFVDVLLNACFGLEYTSAASRLPRNRLLEARKACASARVDGEGDNMVQLGDTTNPTCARGQALPINSSNELMPCWGVLCCKSAAVLLAKVC